MYNFLGKFKVFVLKKWLYFIFCDNLFFVMFFAPLSSQGIQTILSLFNEPLIDFISGGKIVRELWWPLMEVTFGNFVLLPFAT